ncbi:hypothetical protein FRC11_006393 [Ceratobasidium sp. 423]|nr:hypothetical protein FRC11_006393 [Ceratobasidium sp. 423]
MFLDTFSGPQNPEASVIAARIDQALNARHTKLFDELSQPRVILAGMRNKISSRVCSLPNEVLAQIFKDVVYAPGPDDERFPSMTDGIKRIFVRLHSLLAVCSTWKNVGISFSELWSVIPASDSKSRCPSPAATSLALQRSQALIPGHRHLHLAAVLLDRYASGPPFVEEAVPQFTSISIEARYKSPTYDITSLLEKLLSSQTPTVLSELSIHQYQDEMEDAPARIPKSTEYVGCHMSSQHRDLFTGLIGSLSSLRLRSTNIHWNAITFSDKFVDLHLQSVVLGDHAKLNELLSALKSAPELRDVKLISVVAFMGQSPHQNMPFVKISLPKLRSLLLDDLSFNVLRHVLTSISPGSHRLKVGLTHKSESIDYSEEEMDWGGESALDLLNRSNIDTLFLSSYDRESPWVDPEELGDLLQLLPCLKTLMMYSWKWDLKAILALKRPGYSSSFPNLTGLCILDGYITDAHLLPQVIASHSLQTLILDSHPSTLFGGSRDQILECLGSMVPNFCLVRSMAQMDEFNYYTWRFW